MSDYWLSDVEHRVLGPIGLEVLQDLAEAGKLTQIRSVSRDGRTFHPVAKFPEVVSAIGPRSAAETAQSQMDALERVLKYLATIRKQSSHEVFRVAPGAPLDQYRGAFFSIIKRFYPDRLPPETTPELRRACQEVFLRLAALITEVEKSRR